MDAINLALDVIVAVLDSSGVGSIIGAVISGVMLVYDVFMDIYNAIEGKD